MKCKTTRSTLEMTLLASCDMSKTYKLSVTGSDSLCCVGTWSEKQTKTSV